MEFVRKAVQECGQLLALVRAPGAGGPRDVVGPATKGLLEDEQALGTHRDALGPSVVRIDGTFDQTVVLEGADVSAHRRQVEPQAGSDRRRTHGTLQSELAEHEQAAAVEGAGEGEALEQHEDGQQRVGQGVVTTGRGLRVPRNATICLHHASIADLPRESSLTN